VKRVASEGDEADIALEAKLLGYKLLYHTKVEVINSYHYCHSLEVLRYRRIVQLYCFTARKRP
jgi:hypothetical protein